MSHDAPCTDCGTVQRCKNPTPHDAEDPHQCHSCLMKSITEASAINHPKRRMLPGESER